MTVTCAECAGEIDITEARGPDSAGDFRCLDWEACDARYLALREAIDGL